MAQINILKSIHPTHETGCCRWLSVLLLIDVFLLANGRLERESIKQPTVLALLWHERYASLPHQAVPLHSTVRQIDVKRIFQI